MRYVVLAVLVTMAGCNRSEPSSAVSPEPSLTPQRGLDSSHDEVANRIEAGKLYIEAGRLEEARRILNEAAAVPTVTPTEEALIQALLAKIESMAPSSPYTTVPQDMELGAAAPSSTSNSATSINASNPGIPADQTLAANHAKPSAPLGSNDLPAVIDRVRASVAKVTTDKGLGSGFVVDGGLVVTNRHVIEEAKYASVHFSDGTTYSVEGILFDGVELDLCILRCKGLLENNSVPIQLATSPLRQGESVFTFGAPQDLDFSVSQGIVSANRSIDDVEYVQTTAPLSPGNSGGPLLSAADGSVVGINTWSRRGGQNLNFAISVTHLKDALGKLRSEPAPLNLTRHERRATLPDREEPPSLVEALKSQWAQDAAARRKQIDSEIDEVRKLLETTQSPGARSACTERLENLLHELRIVEFAVDPNIPKLDLRRVGTLEVGEYGYTQDRLAVLQVLDNRSCLVTAYGIVYRLEDFPTSSLTTNQVLVADTGPIIYISGTYTYTNKLGAERTVFRLRPAWDAEAFLKDYKERRGQALAESIAQRDDAIQAALLRTWSSPSYHGMASFERSFAILGEHIVKLKSQGWREVKIPFDELSAEDQQWISDYKKYANKLPLTK